MSVEYYSDIRLHQKYRSREYPLTEEGIIAFAREWNPEPFHVDPETAKKSRIGGIFAAGPHLIAICVKLTNEKRPRPASVAGMGWDELRFLKPALPGDRLIAESEVISKRISKSDPNYGIVRYAVQLLNQNDEPVLTYKVSVLVGKR